MLRHRLQKILQDPENPTGCLLAQYAWWSNPIVRGLGSGGTAFGGVTGGGASAAGGGRGGGASAAWSGGEGNGAVAGSHLSTSASAAANRKAGREVEIETRVGNRNAPPEQTATRIRRPVPGLESRLRLQVRMRASVRDNSRCPRRAAVPASARVQAVAVRNSRIALTLTRGALRSRRSRLPARPATRTRPRQEVLLRRRPSRRRSPSFSVCPSYSQNNRRFSKKLK